MLNNTEDPLSDDCGGDCWGCIGEMEADLGYEPSLKQVRQEYKDGLRQDWMPAPETFFNIIGDLEKSCEISLKINLSKPLGEPWGDESIKLRIFFESFENKKQIEIESSFEITNKQGLITYQFKNQPELQDGELWYEVKRNGKSWAYPIRNPA
jgi:hypothetical protein